MGIKWVYQFLPRDPIPNQSINLFPKSEFLADVNAQKGYEGARAFSIFSADDEKVNYKIFLTKTNYGNTD